jgi:hypothetical protein
MRSEPRTGDQRKRLMAEAQTIADLRISAKVSLVF